MGSSVLPSNRKNGFLCGDKMTTAIFVQCLKGLLSSASADFPVYITFKTRAPGVSLPDFVLERFPEEMTIVLRYQFTHLVVGTTDFSVDLSFSSLPAHLVVPFSAIISVQDPEVPWALVLPPLPKKEPEHRAEILTLDFTQKV